MQVKVGILGHFGEGANLLNGQTVKTKIITEELQNRFGQAQILKIDTHGGLKTLLKAPFQTLRALKNSANVLMFPAHNGVRVYAPLLCIQRAFFNNRKIHYVVIGGWLPQFLQKHKWLAGFLKRFDGIYVETTTMKRALEAQGFENVCILPNCKNLRIPDEQELVCPTSAPFKLCTFSRVSKEKGIEDAVRAVKAINEKQGSTVYTLDIYGQIDANQGEWFEQFRQTFPPYVRYRGTVDYDKSVETLKDYFALLFPTRYFTEGLPGTVIDAYAAGLPVIAAKWESFDDIISENTGFGYEFGSVQDLIRVLERVCHNPSLVTEKKSSCLARYRAYSPACAIEVIVRKIGG